MDRDEHIERLQKKIKNLDETVWERRCDWPTVTEWLKQFSPKANLVDEQLQALFLLSNFLYFGMREIRELLKSLFRDLYRYRIVSAIRRSNGDTLDRRFIEKKFQDELLATRFMGTGNPSESGSHLLYYFRQENRLGKKHFIHPHEIFGPVGKGAGPTIREPSVVRYVFIDDLCGSGSQAERYSKHIVTALKAISPKVEVAYYVLFATSVGLDKVRNLKKFDQVDCVVELDLSFKCFSDVARIYDGVDGPYDKKLTREICEQYGKKLDPQHPLGYRDGQLLLGFSHNTPDNTLPIIWYDEPDGHPWMPVFRRYPKEYGWGQ